MPRDILSEYGRDSGAGNQPRASSGGVTSARDVMGYSPPVGPKNINDPKGPGLHGHNCGPCGTQEASSISTDRLSGGPGNGGTNHGNGGSQGRR
jgi:hypothetical protein